MSELENIEPGDELEASEEVKASKDLDETTHDAEAHIEQTRGHEEAEVIEGMVVEMVKGSPEPIDQTKPPGTSDATLEAIGEPDEGDQATPINLPTPEQLAQQHELETPSTPKVAQEESASLESSRELEEQPKQADFERPLVQKGVENEDLGFQDLDSLIPGPGGRVDTGGQDDGGSLIDDVLGGGQQDGLPGDKGIPGMGSQDIYGEASDLIADPETASEPHEMPTRDSPYEFGGGTKGETTGTKGETSDTKGETSGTKGGADVNISATVYTPVEVRQMELDAMRYDAQKNYQQYANVVDKLNQIYDGGGDGRTGGVIWQKDTPDEDVGGPARRETPDPTRDPGQIILETADGVGAPPTGGAADPKDVQLTEEGQKRLKGVFEKKQELANARMKDGSEVVTDPPSPSPGPGSSEQEKGDQEAGKKETGQ